jgi:hypothetical protein
MINANHAITGIEYIVALCAIEITVCGAPLSREICDFATACSGFESPRQLARKSRGICCAMAGGLRVVNA